MVKKKQEKAITALSIQTLSDFLNISSQTLRKRLAQQGFLSSKNKIGNRYCFTLSDCERFIARNYGFAYNSFVDRYLNGKRNEALVFHIPKGSGVISKEKQRSGNVYYYIRELPWYCDDNGTVIKYRSKGFTNKEDATAERQRIIDARDNGLYKYHFIENQQKTIATSKGKPSEANESYYAFCRRFFESAVMSEATRRLYLDITENRIKPFFKDIAINRLSRGLLQQFVDQYSTNIRKMFIVLSKTLKKLFSLDLIPTNYYNALIKPVSTAPHYPKEALSAEETKLFLSYYKGHRLEHCMLLLFQCGLRIGELQALQWADIEILDSTRAKIHISASWGETKEGMARKSTKTASSNRVIPICSKYTIDVLKRAQNASIGAIWVAENETGLRPLDKHNFSKRYFTKVGKLLGIEKHLSSHVARHTFISNLIQKNVPYTEIAKLSGHNTTSMIINVYAHAIQNEEQQFNYVSNLYS